MRHILSFVLLLITAASVLAQRELGARPTDTGGPLILEQASFDVSSYDVAVRVDVAKKSISGTTTMTARITIPTNVIVLDLDTPYTISRITEPAGPGTGARDLKFERYEGKIWIYYPLTKQAGDEISVTIVYAGTPREAPRPPWVGGFIWTKTPIGADWISVALQNDGADLLFPCKDHPSDKPARADVHITVPEPLVATSVGKFVGSNKNGDGTATWNWSMTNPVANYSIIFDAAPYREIKDSYKSITGETVPISFFLLPESFDKGPKLISELKKYTAFFEKYLGPYPFRSQKIGIVETPHLGMEHSTHIAYGNQFRFAPDGFDWLLFHEFGHEWWANLVTASDWRDFWIHEGFQSFMDTLYVEETKGKEAYFAAMKRRAAGTRNMQPIAPREAKIAYQVYMAEPDYLDSDGDIYGKGATVLNTLRYLMGDDAFFRALRRMAYPTKEMEKLTDGRQERLVNTDDFLTIAETECACELDWFFELYLRQPKLPKLVTEVVSAADSATQKALVLRWETPDSMAFPMPLDVEVNGKIQRVEMKDGKASVQFTGTAPVVDPKGWVLKAQ